MQLAPMAAVLLLALIGAASSGPAAAQAIGGKSVLQYHDSATKAGYYVDASLAGACCGRTMTAHHGSHAVPLLSSHCSCASDGCDDDGGSYKACGLVR